MSNLPVPKQTKRSLSVSEGLHLKIPIHSIDSEQAMPTESNWANKYEDFEIGKPIGYGSSAVVYEAMYKPLKKKVAVKMIDLDMFERNQIDELRRETALMALSKHPNVLPVYGSFVNGSKLYIVTPYLAAGSCLDIMKSGFPDGFDEISIATILKQALEGLIYLHKNGHIHRDVKAGNLLMDDQGTVLLADFGVSSSLTENNEMRKTFVGTPCWMAPEVMEQSGYDYKADIWSFGITAYELATGHAPFAKYPPMKVLMMTLSNAPPTLDRENCKHKYSKTFKEMVDICLQKDPSKRPSADKLLLHPFFKQAKRKEYLVKSVLAFVPPLDMRPHKRLPKRHIMFSASDQNWDFDSPEDRKDTAKQIMTPVTTEPAVTTPAVATPAVTAPTAAPAATTDAPSRSKSVVKFKEDPPKPDRTKSVNNGAEKKHITFGDVTIKDAPLLSADKSPDEPVTPVLPSSTPAVTAPKKSRFVVEDYNHSINTTDLQASPSSYSPPTSAHIDINHPGVGLGISHTGPISSVSTINSNCSTLQEGEFKKGRFSVNQTPSVTRPTTPASDELHWSDAKNLCRQDSLMERKSRFEVSHNSNGNNSCCVVPSAETQTLHSAPLTRESSQSSVLYRDPSISSKVSRFSIEKPELVAGPYCEVPTVLPPECRKKGRFELTGGSNTPSDSGKQDKDEKSMQYESPQSTVAPSPAISPSSSLSRGQAHRILDSNFPHMVYSHMDNLLKQTEIQKNMVHSLLATLPSVYTSTFSSAPRSRTVSEASKKPMNNNVHSDDQR
ncbi:putative STE/STE20/FRAY protein kinase [Rhizopus microsporus]